LPYDATRRPDEGQRAGKLVKVCAILLRGENTDQAHKLAYQNLASSKGAIVYLDDCDNTLDRIYGGKPSFHAAFDCDSAGRYERQY
jgi:hypothetical protein